MIVYIDLVILLNFLVDFLLIFGTSKLTGRPVILWRGIVGAGIGGLYGGVCLVPRLAFLGGSLWRVVLLGVVSLVSFGWFNHTVQCVVTFIVLSMALGGVVIGIGNSSIWVIVGCSLCLYFLIRLGALRFYGSQYVKVELDYNGVVRTVTALWDSGNLLKDPLSGESVMVVGADVAEELLSISSEQLKDPICALPYIGIKGMRLLPYCGIGHTGGMLLALRMDSVRINGRKASSLVAFAPENIGGGKFQALIGGNI